MDIFTLDDRLRREWLIDEYESFIWTEKYSAYGDFELVVSSSRGMRQMLPVGTMLVIHESFYVMVVETVEDTTDDEGEATLTITGRSLEALLEDRVNQVDVVSPQPEEPLVYEGTPSAVVRAIFDKHCRNNTANPGDNIPLLDVGPLATRPAGSIPEPTETIQFRAELNTVYSNIKKVCDTYDLGFRLIRGDPQQKLYFSVYTGDNRTTQQSVNDVVIFSPELDNLTNTTQLTSTAQLKNVAYVFAKNGSRVVYAEGTDDTVSGFDRKVLLVEATDIDLVAGPELDAALEQKGKEELAKYRIVIAFDGEVPQFGSYKYGVHYDLGDIVEQRNADGFSTNMRVTEQIFISDREGERSYPTLTSDQTITPGSWYSWSASQTWDLAEGTWDEA